MPETKTEAHSLQMGTRPIGRLLIGMALPLMASNLIQALYNIVDSMFVARVGQEALNAVSLAFPVQNILIAVAVGIGVGMSTRMSHQLGRKDPEGASRTGLHGLVFAFCGWLLFGLLGLLFSHNFISLYTDNPAIIRMGTEYLQIVTIGSLGVFVQIIMERLLLATGRTTLTMWTQLLGAVLNIIFDPLLIFGIGTFPKLGVAGAAIATVLGQISGAVLGIFLNRAKNKEITLSFRTFTFCPEVAKSIFCRSASNDHHVHHLGDGRRHERHSFAFQYHCRQRDGNLFQGAKFCVYAGLRHHQRHESDHCLQLQCAATGTYAQGH